MFFVAVSSRMHLTGLIDLKSTHLARIRLHLELLTLGLDERLRYKLY